MPHGCSRCAHSYLPDQHGQIIWDNVPKLAGQQFQRVLTRAAAFELMLRASATSIAIGYGTGGAISLLTSTPK